MSEPAQTLGQRLKAERERRGMSTQKAADEMHLDAWVIDALEAGDYQRIGPPVYVKGHLKKYASILGLTPAEIAAGFAPQPEAPVVNPAAQSMNIRTTRASSAKAANWPLPQIAAVAAIALVVGGVVWWQQWQRRSAVSAGVGADTAQSSLPASGVSAAAAPAGAASAPGSAPEAEPAAQSAPEEQVADGAPPAPTNAAARPSPAPAAAPGAAQAAASNAHEADAALGAGRARLRLSFSADSWVDVHDADGRRVFAGNGRANSVKTIAGMAPLMVYLGFANGVQLEVNDHAVAIGPQFFTGDVARFEAGADGVLRRAPRAMTPNGVPPHD